MNKEINEKEINKFDTNKLKHKWPSKQGIGQIDR